MQAITKNIEWQFSDKEVTAWGGMRMFKEFYDRTGIREELKRMALPEPGSNAGFDPVVVMESFWMSVWIGGSRFAHTTVVSCQTVSLGPFVVMSDRFSRAICHCLTCARSVPASVNRFKRPEGQSSTGMPVGEWPFRPKGVEQGSKDQNSQGATGIARGGPTNDGTLKVVSTTTAL